MAAILKIISLILWAIDYAKNNPKKATAATLGSGVVAMGLYGGSGVPNNPPATFHGGNSKNVTSATDGQVWTYDSADGKWNPEAAGGGGSGSATGVASVISITDAPYNASGQGGVTTTATGSSGAATLTFAATTSFAVDQYIAIQGAGASHGLTAPAAPTVGVKTNPTFTANATSNVITWSGTTGLLSGDLIQVSNSGGGLPAGLSAATNYYFAPAISWTYVDATDVVTFATPQTLQTADPILLETTTTLPTGVSLATTYYVRMLSTTTATLHASAANANNNASILTLTGGSGTHYAIGSNVCGTTDGQLFTSQANAQNNTSRIDITTAGTGTHSIEGTTTIEIACGYQSGNGGWTAVGSSTTLANCIPRASASFPRYYCVADTTQNGVFASTDSTTQANRWVRLFKNGAPNAYRVTFQAGGYTNAVATDIGKTVTRGSYTGILAGYDNTNRIWTIIPTTYATDVFTSFGAATIGSGTGAGTSTAVTTAHAFVDYGDLAPFETTPVPSIVRRPNQRMLPGMTYVHPAGPTGVQYVVMAMRPTADNYARTSSVETADFTIGTTVNTLYTDGDLQMMVMPRMQPVDEPTTAVQDAKLAQIDNIASTTITLDSNLTNSVTSTRIWHNDFPSFVAASTAANTSTTSRNVYTPAGIFLHFTLDSETDPASQWDDTYVAKNILIGDAGAIGKTFEYATGSTTIWMPTSHRGLYANSGDNDFYFSSSGWNGTRWIGPGRLLYSPTSEVKIWAQDAWNFAYLWGDFNTGVGQFSHNIEFRDLEIWNYSRIFSGGTQSGYGTGLKIINNKMSWGSAQHDALSYVSLQEFSHNTIFGDPYDNSTVVYTNDSADDSVNDTMTITYNKMFGAKGSEAFRIRQPYTDFSHNQVFDSQSSMGILLLDSTSSGVCSDNIFNNGGILNLNGIDWVFSNNKLYNAQIAFNGLVTGVWNGGSVTWDANASNYFQSGNGCVSINGSTTLTITGLEVKNTEAANQGEHGIVIGNGFTTGRLTLSNVNSYSESGYGLNTTSSALNGGFLTWNGGRIRSGVGPQATMIDAHANNTMVFDGVTFDASSAGNTLYYYGGSLTLRDCIVNHAVDSGPTTFLIQDTQFPSGNAAAFGVTTSGKVLDSTFATAPTVTTPSLILVADNQIGTQSTSSPAALASGSTDNYALSIADNHRLDPNAANSTLTGIVAWEDGTEKTITNVDAGAATVTLDEGATASTDANEFTFVAGDLVIPAGQSATIKYDGTSDKWRLKSKTF